MKKTVLILVALLLVLNLMACSKDAPAIDTSNEKKISEKAIQENELKMNEPIEEIFDFEPYFNSIKGCTVILDVETNTYYTYNMSMVEKQESPCSTFKIISTLLGLKYGIIDNKNSTMGYDGYEYSISEWNTDVTLENAFRTSCIWYFKNVINQVGQESVKRELEDLQYGNCDVSEWNGSDVNPSDSLNGFWLESSLKISPINQVQVIADIFEGNAGYKEVDVSLLKEIMLIKEMENEGVKVYGKTGTRTVGTAWLVGFAEKNNKKFYYAIYVDDSPEKISGNKVKEIGFEILKDFLKDT
ncbi:penicillin-binding transpeptidase domain-containing protein [Anaerosporobacter sp.]|uniref:penicillin-binding transpeptidase domain-containing protein n=1 Tax=Anaerosporobacter sp. TaxID=1872529 RepID=UPI00286F9F1A|nr:penicillin-binding transpeptidase domain-containing protein [Anaerosporobacter sp.]